MMTEPRFAMNRNSGGQSQPRRSALRTAGILAGGAGLAYGGIKIGRAAESIRRAAKAGEGAAHAAAQAAKHTAAAADNARVVTGAVRKVGAVVTWPFRKAGNLLRLRFSGRAPQMHFAAGGVAAARYRKQLHDQDVERASGHFTKAAIAGSALGLALRKPGITRKAAAGIGAGAGIVAQGLTRTATASTKDAFGDRSPGGKLVDKLTPTAIGVGALLAGRRRVGAKVAAVKRGAANIARGLPQTIGGAMRSAMGFSARNTRALLHGGALAGGIAAADAATSTVFPSKGETRTDAARHGLAKGAVYGTGLAIAEPLILRALRKAVSTRRKAFGARGRVHQFGGRQQLRDAGNRFVDPLQVASGTQRAYTTDGAGVQHPVDLPVGHAQVVRAAINRGQKLHRIGSRAGGLAKDAVGALAGREKVDSRGRPQKREWEKSWFKRAVGSAAIAGGLLGHAAIMRRNPIYRAKVQRGVQGAKRAANRVVPDLFPLSTKQRAIIALDVTAPDWDVRDQRGRSARVFAPGARPRDRREKKWHERVGNIRRVALLGALAAATGGGVLGYRLGRRKPPTVPAMPETSRIIPFPRAS